MAGPNDRDDQENALRLSHLLVALHVGSVLLLIFVVVSTTFWISSEHNKLARESSERLVASAVDSLRNRAYALVKDYSIWDEGFAAVLEDDRGWLYSNIGVGATDIGSFDLMMLEVPGRGPALGWVANSPPEGEVGLLPQSILDQIISLFNWPNASTATRTSIIYYDGAPWIFAVSRMVTIAGAPLDTEVSELPIQIHGYRLTQERLEQIAQATLSHDIVLTETPSSRQAQTPLTDHLGNVVTYLAWTAPMPGREILRQVAGPLALALLVAATISGLSARYAVRSARELEQALHAAQVADRSKTEFLSNVSHELRTPMNGILGAVQLLGMTELDSEQEELLAVLQSSGNAQMALISDLLDWTKLEGGNRRIAAEPYRPADVLQDVSEMTRVAANRKNIRFDCTLQALEGVCLIGDSRALRQIVTNLLGNAVKFTEEGSVSMRARLTRRDTRGNLVIEIADTGTGIPTEALDRIFERFYRVDGSLTRSTEGTGLGLAISRKLAGLTGAVIEVDSRVGIGSVFTYRANVQFATDTPEAVDAA